MPRSKQASYRAAKDPNRTHQAESTHQPKLAPAPAADMMEEDDEIPAPVPPVEMRQLNAYTSTQGGRHAVQTLSVWSTGLTH